jgi:hypothetical protein
VVVLTSSGHSVDTASVPTWALDIRGSLSKMRLSRSATLIGPNKKRRNREMIVFSVALIEYITRKINGEEGKQKTVDGRTSYKELSTKNKQPAANANRGNRP